LALPVWGFKEVAENDTFCGHDHVWTKFRKPFLPLHAIDARAATCPLHYDCDRPEYRDSLPQTQKTLRVKFHIAKVNGNTPTQAVLDQQFAFFANVWASLSVTIENVGFQFHDTYNLGSGDLPVKCTAAYSSFSSQWYTDAENYKKAWSDGLTGADRHMNIIISCMTPGTEGQLNGYGAFPWDSTADTAAGGVFLNNAAVTPTSQTLAHELGHNFGLWHTFHGSAEVNGCSDPCSENVHSSTLTAPEKYKTYSTQGDFCSDTAATSKQWTCTNDPVGTDCNRVAWGQAIDYKKSISENIMSYSACRKEFSPEQTRRAHCFMCHSFLESMVQGC